MDHHWSLLTTEARQRRQKKILPKAVSLGASAPYWPVDLAIFGDRGGPKSVKMWKFWGKVKILGKKFLVQNWLYGPPLLTSDHRGPTTTTKKKFPKAASLGAESLWARALFYLGDFRRPGGSKIGQKMDFFGKKIFIFSPKMTEKMIFGQNFFCTGF